MPEQARSRTRSGEPWFQGPLFFAKLLLSRRDLQKIRQLKRRLLLQGRYALLQAGLQTQQDFLADQINVHLGKLAAKFDSYMIFHCNYSCVQEYISLSKVKLML